jgi:hypothetical protein
LVNCGSQEETQAGSDSYSNRNAIQRNANSYTSANSYHKPEANSTPTIGIVPAPLFAQYHTSRIICQKSLILVEL